VTLIVNKSIYTDVCQEVQDLHTVVDQMNTQSKKILKLPGIKRIEKEYINVLHGKFIAKILKQIVSRLGKLCIKLKH